MRTELELSGQDRPYLVLDLAASRLTLTMHGNALRDYPVLDWQRRVPRLGFVVMGPAPAVASGTWTLGQVVPRRRLVVREIVPTDPVSDSDGGAASAMPPLPEELVAAPPRYAIHFGEGSSLEIRAGGETRGRTSWRDRFEVLTGSAAPGLSVVLSPEDAGSLYRSLGADVAVVIR